MPVGELPSRILSWVLRLLEFLRTLPRDRVTSALVTQLVRSGTSIGANFAEAQCGASRRDFANFLRHALKSARESEYWLQVLRQDNETSEIYWLQNELNQIVRILFSIVSKLGTRKLSSS